MSRNVTRCLAPLFVAITVTASAEENCLRQAWKSFEAADYKTAIASADNCIDTFAKAATRDQASVKNTPLPKEGAPASVEEQTRIFKRGLLNDVGTAWFIKGRSAEHLMAKKGRDAATWRKVAEDAYKAACEYPHAMTWDPKGWFWSPCTAAKDRLPLPPIAGRTSP